MLRCGFVGRLADEQPGVGRDGGFHRVVVAGLHLNGFHAEAGHVLRAEFAAAMITLVEEDDFVAGVELGHQEADHRRHAAGVEHGHLAALERGEFALGNALAGVAVTAVFFARLLFLDEVDDRLACFRTCTSRRRRSDR